MAFLIPYRLSTFCWALGSDSVRSVTGILQGAEHFFLLDSSLPFVPPGAVTVGRQERVSLVLVWDLTDAPSLSHRQGLVSPVVACGPHGASFLKPCTLTFKHCAQQPSQACAYSSNTSLLDAKDWKPLGQPGLISPGTSVVSCSLTSGGPLSVGLSFSYVSLNDPIGQSSCFMSFLCLSPSYLSVRTACPFIHLACFDSLLDLHAPL